MDPLMQGSLLKAVRRRGLLPALAAILCACLLAATGAPLAQGEDSEGEYRIKAAFLYKFGSYIEWPEGTFPAADSPFVIGVMGSSQVAQALTEMVADRAVAGRRVEVRELQPADSLIDIQELFVGRGLSDQVDAVLSTAAGLPILTVTEREDGPPPDSIINFVVTGNKVRFDVALPVARMGNLKVSARLLAVARKVVNGAS